jgi:hypothetical protein
MSAVMAAARVVPMAKAALWAVAACALCSSISFAGGIWAGIEWQQGRQAQKDNKSLRTEVNDLYTATAELRQRALDVVQDFRTSQLRLESITEGHENDRITLEHVFTQQRAENERWLETRLDLYGCRIGADGMQSWNAASAGTATHTATSGAPNAAHALPALPAAIDRGSRPGDDAQPLPGSGAIPPLPVREGSRDGGAGVL